MNELRSSRIGWYLVSGSLEKNAYAQETITRISRIKANTAFTMNQTTPRTPFARPGRPKTLEKKIIRSMLKAFMEAMLIAKPFVCLFMYGRIQHR